MTKRMCGVLFVLAALLVAPRAYGQEDGGLTYDGIERTYTVYTPSSYDGSAAVPLVVVLHPFASSGKAMEALTGFDAAADEHGFMAVYPDSADMGWDDGRIATGWPTQLTPSDDVGFITALIDHLSETYTIDPARVYLTGFAGGGSMAYKLACEAPERFAKVAVVGSLLWDYIAANCPADAAPVSMLTLLGTKSIDMPFAGDTFQSSWSDTNIEIFGAEDTIGFWAKHNGCDLDNVLTPGGVGPFFSAYEACDNDTSVALYMLEGVGQNWPRVGDYVLNQFGMDATTIVTDFFLAEPGESLTVQQTQTGDVWSGFPRSYWLYVPPSYDPAEPMPLAIVLHGRPSNGGGMAYLLDANRAAAERGMMMLYPDGLPVAPGETGREWNYTRGTPGYRDSGVDDVAFLVTLVDDLAQDLNIDRDRVYVTGFSNGGFMTQRVACEAGDQFAGFASVGATLFPDFIGLCAGQTPVPMLLMHGTQDASVAWEGQMIGQQIAYFPASDTALFWVGHDGCVPDATDLEVFPKAAPEATTEVYLYTFGGCQAGSEVYFYVIDGGGHNLPGVADRLIPDIAGNVNMDIRAGDVILDFFARHSLAEREPATAAGD
jgi:polyhydroxybutyrate depolymerase